MNGDYAGSLYYAVKDGLLVRDLDGEVVILDPELDQIHQLNATAGMIWRALAKGATAEEAARMLERNFALDGETARSDVGDTVKKFRELRLLVSGERGEDDV